MTRKKFAFHTAVKTELFQAATGFSKSAFSEASASTERSERSMKPPP
ncbi:hypothetical protein AGR1A_Lc80228 [Agrobacterium fabacearum CFBP 5771]|nr:hypothetical protein AGR1A_Lc80228 [Agrobacterium fabacearum CFBP 5771]